MKTMLRPAFAGAMLLALAAMASASTSVVYEATDNATIGTGGPIFGASGKNFFNVLGTGTGSQSFGVAEFDFSALKPSLPATFDTISNVALLLTEANSNGVSAPGSIGVYYTSHNDLDIQPGTSSLAAVSGKDGKDGIDTQLEPVLQSTGLYGDTATGDVDTVSITLTSDAEAALKSALKNGTVFRLIVTAEAANVAATFAGDSNSTLAGPTLTFELDAVPEPSSLILGGLGLLGLLAIVRQRHRQCS
jgi:PEP-CTERM motif